MAMKQRYKSELANVPSPVIRIVDGEVKEPEAKFRLSTLGELGANLPIGIQANGARIRQFRLRPFKMKQEKALSKLREEAKGGAAKFVADALAMMVQTVGPHNFDQMKDGERQLIINQLPMPDVLYLYLYLRHDALGEEPVLMMIRCPSCKSEYKWWGDLSSMEVRVVPDQTPDLTRLYELRDEFTLRGKLVKQLKLDVMKWDAMSRGDIAIRESQQNAVALASIVGIEGFSAPAGTLQLIDGDLDEMTKFDLGGIIEDIEDNTPGPQLDIEPECPNCKHKQKMMMDWSWDNFFRRSAQRPRGQT